MLDDALGDSVDSFRAHVRGFAEHLAHHPAVPRLLDEKWRARGWDERIKALSASGTEGLASSH